jgi:Flp pilus assembly protein TadG
MVEFAMTLPLLVLIMLGTIEACSMIYLKQNLQIAAYEAARAALVMKSSAAVVNTTAKRFLDDRRVRNATVTITPSTFATEAVGTWITVKIEAPSNDNFGSSLLLFKDLKISSYCSMMKEY